MSGLSWRACRASRWIVAAVLTTILMAIQDVLLLFSQYRCASTHVPSYLHLLFGVYKCVHTVSYIQCIVSTQCTHNSQKIECWFLALGGHNFGYVAEGSMPGSTLCTLCTTQKCSNASIQIESQQIGLWVFFLSRFLYGSKKVCSVKLANMQTFTSLQHQWIGAAPNEWMDFTTVWPGLHWEDVNLKEK